MTQHELSSEDPALLAKIAELEAQLNVVEARQKENQTSLFAAIKTLVGEVDEYRQGKRDFSSLRPAAHGLLFAYLRPRIMLVAGGFLAALLGIAQLWFLWNQQKLLEQQNILVAQQGRVLTEQTKANKVAAVSELVLALDPRDSVRSHLAAIQLSNFGEYGFGTLIDLSQGGGPTAEIAASVLYSQADIQSPAQIAEILARWAHSSVRVWDSAPGIHTEFREQSPAVDYPISDASQEHLHRYVGDIGFRIDKNRAFRGELRSAILARDAGVLLFFIDLYGKNIAACREPLFSWCVDAFGQDRAPKWHYDFYELMISLRTDISIEQREILSGKRVYGSLVSPNTSVDDVTRTILSWTVDGSPVETMW